jgi:hypothetical protein
MRELKGVAMNIRQQFTGGFIIALCLGMLLGAVITPAEARDASVRSATPKHFPSESVQPGVSQSGRPLYSPPVFMDRGTPISERPLAPIGNGGQVAPESVPFAWCHGQWVRVDNPWHSCSSR